MVLEATRALFAHGWIWRRNGVGRDAEAIDQRGPSVVGMDLEKEWCWKMEQIT